MLKAILGEHVSEGMGQSGSRTVKSVDTAITLLEELRRHDDIGVTELAEELEMSKSSVHHYLSTLEDRDLVTKVDGNYRMGLRFLAFGGHARELNGCFQDGREKVDTLARELNENVRLIVENAGYGLTLYQANRENESHPEIHTGSLEYLHCSAAGRAFLASLPRKKVEPLINTHESKKHLEDSIVDLDTFFTELEQTRMRGIAFDDEERYQGIRSVATTFIDDSTDQLAAISVSAPIERMDEKRFQEELPNHLRDVVKEIEQVDTYDLNSNLPCISRTMPE